MIIHTKFYSVLQPEEIYLLVAWAKYCCPFNRFVGCKYALTPANPLKSTLTLNYIKKN